MKTKWQLIWSESALKDLKKIDKHIAKIIVLKTISAIEEAKDIKDVLIPLKHAKKGQHIIRIGSYRVICLIKNDQCVVQAISLHMKKANILK